MWQNAHDAYLESRVLSADPLELVHLLYEAAIEAVREARRYLAAGETAVRGRQRPGTSAVRGRNRGGAGGTAVSGGGRDRGAVALDHQGIRHSAGTGGSARS